MPRLLPDVNVLIYAHRPEMAHHPAARRWLEQAVDLDDSLVLPDLVLAGYLRLVTNPRVFATPTPLPEAVESLAALLRMPNVERVSSGGRHLELLLTVARDLVGDRVADAYVAAIAAEQQATVVTWDRGFGRFKDVLSLTPQP